MIEDWLEKQMMKDFEHDRNAPWWKAKRRPGNLFETAPLFFTAVLLVWVIAAGIPAIAMLSPSVACWLGATETWCAHDQ